MPSSKAIFEAFGLLGTLGVQGGPANEDAFAAAAKIWGMILKDMTDKDLLEATLAYLRDEKVCQFWPQPGMLLARVPGRQAALLDDSEEMFTKAMNYLMSCPPRWVDPEAPNIGYYDPAPGRVPKKYPPPPWPPERHDAVMRATEAMGLERYTRAEHDIQQGRAKDAWMRAYRAAVKGESIAIEGAAIRQITGGQRQIAEAK